MRVVCISDTHCRHEDLLVPDGDLLVHAGDMSRRGTFREIVAFNHWLGTLPHRHKVVIAGNHDFAFEQDVGARSWLTHAEYLQDSELTIEGLRIWGSPWQPRFFDWAFNLDRGKPLREKWKLIPSGLDILLTHGPPHGILDRTDHGTNVGCEDLAEIVALRRPRLHVFGHIHEAAGCVERGGTTYVNACSLDRGYEPRGEPFVLDL